MKYIFKNLLILVISIMSIEATSLPDCNSQCSIVLDEFGGETSDLNCTLPSKNAKMRIIAEDVFDSNGNLKFYFGTSQNVCDVLGWMNEGAEKFSEVGEKYSYAKA